MDGDEGDDNDDDEEMTNKRTHDCPTHVSRIGHFDRTANAPLSIFAGLAELGHYSGGTRSVYGRVSCYVDLGSAWPLAGCWRARVVRYAQREGEDPHHFAQFRVDETRC